MPGIVDLVELISLDVTRGLVQQGLGLGFDGRRYTITGSPMPLGIVGATNATPIVLTCDRPHAIPLLRANGQANVMHAIVGGVLGNTAANAVDTEPLSRTVGLSLGVALVPLSATTFAMYLPSSSTGALAPLAGNGTYAGGGTITPGLTAGQILLGRDHTRFELSPAGAPPFIAFVPAPSGVKFNARAPAHGAVRLTGELANQIKYRALWTEWTLFEVHTWGAAYPPDSKLDFDVTQRLYQQVIQSVHLLCSGDYRLDEGSWDDQAPKATQLVKLGHYNVMRIALGTPVLEFAMPFVVPPITLSPTTYFQPPDGSAPEVGCQG